MSYTFIELDIFSAVSSKYYGRILTSADSPIEVPVHEAEPWIRGQYALPCGTSIELSDEQSCELQDRLQAMTAEFLKECRENESGRIEASRGIGNEFDDEHVGPDDNGVGGSGGAVGESEPLDGD